MKKMFWVLNVNAYSVLILVFVIVNIWDIQSSTYYVLKLITNLVTIIPSTALLWYYGRHASNILNSRKFNCLWCSIVAFSIYKLIFFAFQEIHDRINSKSLQETAAEKCSSDPIKGHCGDCIWMDIYIIMAYFLCEFVPMILILRTMKPKNTGKDSDVFIEQSD